MQAPHQDRQAWSREEAVEEVVVGDRALICRGVRLLVDDEVSMMSKETLTYQASGFFRPLDSGLYIHAIELQLDL